MTEALSVVPSSGTATEAYDTYVNLPQFIPMSKAVAVKAPRGCPVRHHSRDQEDFEKDFTTQGKVGELECPFAKMAQNGLPTAPNSQDPIAAEFHMEGASTTSPHPTMGKCPIRFLDKHTPEEVAKYFENHKHEIPRSHAVCVQRYQKNEDSIRKLDAKYGNLVNMIQGLGVKHKQYLPEDDIATKEQASSTEAVEKWADGVSEDSDESEQHEQTRASHFERPLREVRVGESPSRPWGISVPAVQEIPPSALQSENGQHRKTSSPVAAVQTDAVPLSQSPNKTATKSKKGTTNLATPSPIIFNGPVFIGYSPEDAAKFLHHLGLEGGIGHET